MNLSASKVGLLGFCSFWARPEVKAPPRGSRGLAARGTGMHGIIEAHIRAGHPLSPAEVDALISDLPSSARALIAETYQRFAEHPIAAVPWIPETPFAYDPTTDTARKLPQNKGQHRDYSDLRPGEIPGTPDAYLYDATTRTVHVVDWKTGEGNEARDILSAGQGEFNALMLSRCFGAARAVVTECDLTPEGPQIKQRRFETEELDALALKLSEQLAEIPTSEPRPGHHCSELWCPAQAVCPETARAELALVPGTALAFRIENPMQAGRLLHRLKVVRAACDAAEQAVHHYADKLGGSFPLEDGRRYQRKEAHPRTIDMLKPGAPEAVGEHYLPAVLPTLTGSAIEARGRARGLKGKDLDKEVRAVYDRLDAVGAVERGTMISYEPTGKRVARAEQRAVEAPRSEGRRLEPAPAKSLPAKTSGSFDVDF